MFSRPDEMLRMSAKSMSNCSVMNDGKLASSLGRKHGGQAWDILRNLVHSTFSAARPKQSSPHPDIIS